MKYLIVGLGNPGLEYVETRHNVGFKILDHLSKDLNGSGFVLDRLAEHAVVKYKGRVLHCIKPTTYMNLSGKALKFWMNQEKIKPENILVLVDDIALPFGTLRLKTKGSDGGHNGLKDIAIVLATQNYSRLRFGVGSDFSKGRQVDYVLGNWSQAEQNLLPEYLEKSISFIKMFVSIGAEKTMSELNNT